MYAALAAPPALPARLSPSAARSRSVRARRPSSAPAPAISRTAAFIPPDVARDPARAQAPPRAVTKKIRKYKRPSSGGTIGERPVRRRVEIDGNRAAKATAFRQLARDRSERARQVPLVAP